MHNINKAKTYTCSAGTYLNVTTCAECPAGSYCPGDDFTYNGSVQGLNRCPEGYGAGSSAATAETDCLAPAGYYVETAYGTPKICPQGSWCEYGIKYGSTSTAILCPDNSTSKEGSTHCICKDGYILESGSASGITTSDPCVEVSGCSIEGIKAYFDSQPLCTIDNGPYTTTTIGGGTITGYDVSGFGDQSASSCCTAAGGLLSRNYFCACALLQ